MVRSEKRQDRKKFWELINRERKYKTNISDRILMNEWVKHFKKQFDGKESIQDSTAVIATEPEQEELNIDEVSAVIEKKKKRKLQEKTKYQMKRGYMEVKISHWNYIGYSVKYGKVQKVCQTNGKREWLHQSTKKEILTEQKTTGE